MSWITATDPLALVAIQGGQVGTPSTEAAAAGNSRLDVEQRSIVVGEPVPIAFCRRRNGYGGILISPGASEARFENNASNAVTASYLLVLSEGQLPGIQVRDVFQGPCRVGSHSQTYNRRAGTWEPGNFITDKNAPYRRFFNTQTVVNLDTDEKKRQYNLYLSTPLTDPAQLTEYPFDLFTWYEAELTNPAEPDKLTSWTYKVNGQNATVADIRNIKGTNYVVAEASSYCGSKGAYPGMTTVSFQSTIPDGFDLWKKQIHFYLRGGMQVTRLTDAQVGPSDNFCDLVQWMMQASGRFPAALIDTARLSATAHFLEDNELTCNCWITESSNYLDYLAKWAPLFLVCESNVAGKRGLRPILPITASNQIDTGAIVPVYTFSEDHILPDTLEIQYTSLADRRPFVVQAIWRQQLEDDFGIVRTAEVRLTGTAPDGPYESHDLSEFCTRESHAVKVGAYILAKRVYTSHTIRFTAKPQANNLAVTQGDIIRVRLARQASTAGISYHDFLYQVERITKTLAGELSYECTHFPIDSQGRSLISLAVANATGGGIQLSSNKSGLGCDLNSASNTTVPAETFSDPDLSGINAGLPIGIDVGGIEAPPGTVSTNPDDGLDGPSYTPHSLVAPPGVTNAVPGVGIDPGVGVCGTNGTKSLTWYKNGTKIVGYQYPPGGGSAVITYESPTEDIPAWLSPSEGILAIGTGDEGSTYTSVVECTNGAVSGKTTLVKANQPGQPGQPAEPGYMPSSDRTLYRCRLISPSFGNLSREFTSYGPPSVAFANSYTSVMAVSQSGTKFQVYGFPANELGTYPVPPTVEVLSIEIT